MDTKRLITFVLLSVAILFGWQHWFAPKPSPTQIAANSSQTSTSQVNPGKAGSSANTVAGGLLQNGSKIKVRTDLIEAQIDTMGGDIRSLQLLKHAANQDASKPLVLFQQDGDHTYIAQTGLIKAGSPNLPTHRTLFTAQTNDVRLAEGEKSVSLRLQANEVDGIKVAKILTFHRGSYKIDVAYEITNTTATPLQLSAYYRLLRDSKVPAGSPDYLGSSSFTGPAVFTDAAKFQKVEFKDIDKDKADYVKQGKDGWVGMLQHYFASAWLLSPKNDTNVCASNNCRFEIKPTGEGLYSAGAIVDLPAIAAATTKTVNVGLYAGPQETRQLEMAAEGLELVKDYGIFTVLAKPAFWLLDLIHGFVGNWGWAIVVFTILIKLALYPLALAQFRSMAKMKKLAPRMQQLKERYGEDRIKFQQAVMEMYKEEKANPLSGCLPLLIQMPIFIALYWMLQAAVELRHAPWMGWISDLSAADPYYILPILMGLSSYAMTFFNPPSTDPMQDKMMKIMPVAFSVMFIFFPSGLVLYYVVSNVFQIGQQLYVTKKIEREDALVKAKA